MLKNRYLHIPVMSAALFAFWGLLVFDGCPAHATSFPHTLERSRAKILNVGEALMQEVLPLSMGQSLYELHGLKAPRWYELKISYPASIPARFSIAIVHDNSTKGFDLGRRLLNTEKLIFKADSIVLEASGYNKIVAIVSVEPAGIVARSHFREQQFVTFNIVCDELLFGIPNQAWWVVFLIVLGIAIILSVPNFLPPEWLPRESSQEHMKRIS